MIIQKRQKVPLDDLAEHWPAVPLRKLPRAGRKNHQKGSEEIVQKKKTKQKTKKPLSFGRRGTSVPRGWSQDGSYKRTKSEFASEFLWFTKLHPLHYHCSNSKRIRNNFSNLYLYKGSMLWEISYFSKIHREAFSVTF